MNGNVDTLASARQCSEHALRPLALKPGDRTQLVLEPSLLRCCGVQVSNWTAPTPGTPRSMTRDSSSTCSAREPSDLARRTWTGGGTASAYGVSVVGVTVSREQQCLAAERGRGLPVEFRLQDYRDLAEPFDAIVSIGMFEHVGAKNYRGYFEVVRRCLAADGLFLLHTIGSRASSPAGDRWIARYIFPNSHLPSMLEITRAVGRSFVIEDWHNFGADYDRTLLAWERNFTAHWPRLQPRYDERFRRMWRYYLLSCAGTFRARHNQLWQIVLSKDGVAGGYRAIR